MKNTDVDNWVANTLEEQKAIIEELRALLFEKVPNINEQFKWGRPVYGLEKDLYYLKTTKKHVTFGFFEFEKVQTNQELLEGTGKQMRHVKINKKEDIADLKLTNMIVEVSK